MPIRIQRVFADSAVPTARYPRASGEDFGAGLAGVTYQAGRDLAAGSLNALDTFARADALLRKEEIAADVREKKASVEAAYTDDLIAIRESGTDPAVYAQQAEDALKGRIAEAQGSLRYANDPAAVREFQKAIGEFALTSVKNAKLDGFARRNALVEAQDDLELDKLARVASTGSPKEVAEALGKAKEIIDKGVASFRYSGEQAAAKSKMVLRGMQMGIVLKDEQNPETRGSTMVKLMGGEFPHIGPLEDQQRLARTLATQRDADETKRRTTSKESLVEAQREVRLDLIQRATDKTLTVAELNARSREWQLHDTDYQRILGVLQAPTVEAASDEATLRRVIADTHSQFPRMTERELNALKDAGRLNTKDWSSALDRLVSTRRHNQEYGHTIVMQHHSQAEQELMKSLGVVTPFSKLDPVQEKLIPLALRSLRLQSNAYPGGKEPPLKVLDAELPRWQKALEDETRLTIDQIRRVALYPDRAALQRARDANQISDAVYQAQRPMMDTLFDLIDKQEQRRLTNERKGVKPGGARKPEQ